MNTMTANIGDTQSLLASVGVGMWLWDGDLLRLQMDSVCKAFFELDPDQEPEQSILNEKIAADDLESYRRAIQACKDSGEFACEFRVRRTAGGFRYLSGRGHTVNQREAAFFIQGVFIDVTATKELENRLKDTQSRMQEPVSYTHLTLPTIYSV